MCISQVTYRRGGLLAVNDETRAKKITTHLYPCGWSVVRCPGWGSKKCPAGSGRSKPAVVKYYWLTKYGEKPQPPHLKLDTLTASRLPPATSLNKRFSSGSCLQLTIWSVKHAVTLRGNLEFGFQFIIPINPRFENWKRNPSASQIYGHRRIPFIFCSFRCLKWTGQEFRDNQTSGQRVR